jgi:hypothetical protein
VPDGYPRQVATPEAAHKQLIATLTSWVLGAARRQTLVILLADLHWADPSTLELQTLLVHQAATERLLLVYTTRPNFVVPWPERTHYTQVIVNRLLKRHVRDMVTQVAMRSRLLADIVDQLAARTDGVPLFVEELTKSVIEAGASAARDIPATLAESLMTRIDRLGQPAKDVVQVGAVCGREFQHRLLGTVHPVPEDALDDALRTLVEAELLYVRGSPPDAIYAFRHALVQDAAYDSLAPGRRQALHAEVATALVTQDPALGDDHPEVLAHHQAEAGLSDQAIASWQRAGDRALRRGALSEAERHFARGIALLPQVADERQRDTRELELQLSRGRLFVASKGTGAPETVAAYARARQVASRVGGPDQLVALLAASWALDLMREGPGASRPLADELLRAAEESGLPWWLALGHLAQTVTRFHAADFAGAYAHVRLGQPHSRQEPLFPLPMDLGVMTAGYGAYAAWHLGLVGEARALAAEVAERAETIGRPCDRALAAQFRMIFHATMLGDLAAAEADAKRGLAACAEEPNPAPESSIQIILGRIRAEQGQPEVGLASMRPALDRFLATGQRLGLGYFLGLVVETLTLAGRTAEALRELDDSESAGLGEDNLRSLNLARRAALLEQAGADAAIVAAAHEDALACARSQGTRGFELRVALGYATWLMGQHRPGTARELLSPLCARLDERDDSHDAQSARSLLAELGHGAGTEDRGALLAIPGS